MTQGVYRGKMDISPYLDPDSKCTWEETGQVAQNVQTRNLVEIIDTLAFVSHYFGG